MTYVMSDLHGQFEKYQKMLALISFSDEDVLYVLGDVVDRGDGSAKLLRDMSMRVNVYPILGNHDLMAAVMLRKLCVEITDENYAYSLDEETLEAIALWQEDGGKPTLDAFLALEQDERTDLLEYLDEFMLYEELDLNGKKFILVHGGIPYAKRNVPMEEQNAEDLLSVRPDYGKRYSPEGSYLVTGHTPTALISPQYQGKIYRQNGHIAIDCGAGFGLPLGCIRLEDMKEFYVE